MEGRGRRPMIGMMIRTVLAAVLLLGLTSPTRAEMQQLTCARDGVRSEPLPAFLVVEIQESLAALGYRPGPADGILSPRTRASIQAFKAGAEKKPELSTREHQLNMLLSLLPAEAK